MNCRSLKQEPPVPSRRRKWLRRLAILGVVLAVVVLAYACFVEPTRLEVTHTEILSPRLPEAMGPVRIAHLSDIHWTGRFGEDLIRETVELANQARPDLIVFTGDTVNSSYSGDLAGLRDLLSPLTAPLGVFAVLGNHDRWAGAEQVIETLEESGVRVLRDEAVPVRIGQSVVWLVGLRDNSINYASPAPLVEGLPEGARYIVLAHSPDVVFEANELGAGLVLAGHTHGGQICLPLWGPLIVPSRFGRRFTSGLIWQQDTPMYVSRGIGMAVVHARLLCRPELAVLEVRGSTTARNR